MRYILIIFMIFNFSTSTWGQENSTFKSTWVLYQTCKAELESDRLYCDFYLGGFYEGVLAIQILNSYESTKALNIKIEDVLCLPNPIKTSIVREMFLEWTEKHPEDHDSDKTSSLLLMFRENFPCDPSGD